MLTVWLAYARRNRSFSVATNEVVAPVTALTAVGVTASTPAVFARAVAVSSLAELPVTSPKVSAEAVSVAT